MTATATPVMNILKLTVNKQQPHINNNNHNNLTINNFNNKFNKYNK